MRNLLVIIISAFIYHLGIEAQISPIVPMQRYDVKAFDICPVSYSEMQHYEYDSLVGKIPYDYYAAFNCDVKATLDTVFYTCSNAITLTAESTIPCYVIFYGKYSNGQEGNIQVINLNNLGADNMYRKTVHYDWVACNMFCRVIVVAPQYILLKKGEQQNTPIFVDNMVVSDFDMSNLSSSVTPYCRISVSSDCDDNYISEVEGFVGNNMYILKGGIYLGDIGYKYYTAQLPQQRYSIFTAQSTNDVEMFVMNTDNEIIAHNNDYTGQSGHIWGTEARVNLSGNDSVKAVILIPHRSYFDNEYNYIIEDDNVYVFEADTNTEGKTDLYLGCRFLSYNGLSSQFPNLFNDDALITDIGRDYNCYAWTAYPAPKLFNQGYLIGTHTAASIAYYLINNHGYTDIGATENNSDADIWELNGCATHTSVRSYGKGAGGNSYGYDWESKLGGSERIMHPRYALVNDESEDYAYGHVVKHLIKNPNYVASEIIYENVEFTEGELIQIADVCSLASQSDKELFSELFSAVKDTILQNFVSNYEIVALHDKNCQELIKACSVSTGMLGLVLEKLAEGDDLAAYLFIKATKDVNDDAVQHVLDYETTNRESDTGEQIICLGVSEATLYAKDILSKLRGESCMPQWEGISYSNDTEVLSVKVADGSINVCVKIEKPSGVSLMIDELNGMNSHLIFSEKKLDDGAYNYNYNINKKGIYAVTLKINGRIYIQKVTIN